MNRTLSLAAILVMAAPLFAADPKPVVNPTQPAEQAGDSPLVVAAKRANRLGKKPAFVITNENLVTTGGHFTTTAQQAPITLPPPTPQPKPAVDQQQKKANRQADAESKQHAAEKRRRDLTQAGTDYEDAYSEDDPASVEHRMEQLSKQQQEQKKKQ